MLSRNIRLMFSGACQFLALLLFMVGLIACAPRVAAPPSPSPPLETPSPTLLPQVASVTPSFTP
jgi:hypothetical protein